MVVLAYDYTVATQTMQVSSYRNFMSFHGW